MIERSRGTHGIAISVAENGADEILAILNDIFDQSCESLEEFAETGELFGGFFRPDIVVSAEVEGEELDCSEGVLLIAGIVYALAKPHFKEQIDEFLDEVEWYQGHYIICYED